MDTQTKKKFLLELLFVLAVGAIIFVSTRLLVGYLMPFLIALIVAAISQRPAQKAADKLKIKRGIAAAVLAALIFILAVIAVLLLIYFSAAAIRSFMGDLPQLLENGATALSDIKNSILSKIEDYSPRLYYFLNDAFNEGLGTLFAKVTNSVSGWAADIARSVPSFLFGCLAAFVAGCYIAKDYSVLKAFFRSVCGEKVYGNIVKVKGILLGSVLKILRGYLTLMLLTFLQLLLGFWLLGIKHTVFLSVIVAFIDLLPVFGTGTVLLPWGLFELFTGAGIRGAGLLILYIIITVVRNFAEPKIIGRQIGINPLFTLFAMFLGLRLFGAFGLIVFPVTLITIIKYYKDDMQENNMS